MEHAAVELKVDPVELRMINQMVAGSPILPPPKVLETQNPIPEYVAQLKESSEFDQRMVDLESFNKASCFIYLYVCMEYSNPFSA